VNKPLPNTKPAEPTHSGKSYPRGVRAHVSARAVLPSYVYTPDVVLGEAGGALSRVMKANPALTLWGLSSFEYYRGFDGDGDAGYSLDNIKGIADTLEYTLANVGTHYRDRALMLSCEYLERFIAARKSIYEPRFIRTPTVNRARTSWDWMRIAGQSPHGVFLAACITEGLVVEPIIDDGKFAGDAFLNLALRFEVLEEE
jgi:hypothetical protein